MAVYSRYSQKYKKELDDRLNAPNFDYKVILDCYDNRMDYDLRDRYGPYMRKHGFSEEQIDFIWPQSYHCRINFLIKMIANRNYSIETMSKLKDIWETSNSMSGSRVFRFVWYPIGFLPITKPKCCQQQISKIFTEWESYPQRQIFRTFGYWLQVWLQKNL